MGDLSGKIDVEKLISYSDDLVSVLKDDKDSNNLALSLQHSQVLRSSCDTEFHRVRTQIQDYERRIDECKMKTDKAKLEIVSDEQIDSLRGELESELEAERLLKEELRVIVGEISELEREWASVVEQKQAFKKLEQEDLRSQRKLSMYASVTNIIPNLDDHTTISGHIVHRDKKVVEKFEFDPTKMTTFDACQSIWKMINP